MTEKLHSNLRLFFAKGANHVDSQSLNVFFEHLKQIHRVKLDLFLNRGPEDKDVGLTQ